MSAPPTLAAARAAYRAATRAYAGQVVLEAVTRRALHQLAGTADLQVLRTVSAVEAGHLPSTRLAPDSDAGLLYSVWQAYRREYAGLDIVADALDDAEADLAAVLHRTRLIL